MPAPQVTEELYKKNLELYNSNRALSLLQKLYEIMVNTLDPVVVSKKFLDTITTDLEFKNGRVMLLNKANKSLVTVAVTDDLVTQNILKEISKPINTLTISVNGTKNLFLETISTRSRLITTNYLDLWDGWIPAEKRQFVTAQATSANLTTSYIYPINLNNESIGVFVLTSDKSEQDLSSFEKSLLFEIANVFGVGVDRAMLYNNLDYANKQLKELDQRKDEFLNIAAHELRAPMTAIKGYLSMIMEGDAGAIPDQVKEFLKEAATSNDRLIRLVNNMLNTARIEENRQVYTMAVVNLGEVTQTVFNEFKQDAVTKKLTYNFVNNATIQSVYVDQDRIHEVIGNFISNAIKYTDTGSIQVTLKNPTPTTIRFDVVDTGPGIPQESQARLFEKFYRVENENLKRAPGTGLGLYISKLLVEKFSGHIGFSSEVGKGSNFWFELPITTTEPKVEPHVMV